MQPKHPRAREFIQKGLFNDLTAFSQLEDRISVLVDPWAQQAAFEVFAEAYLATRRLVLVKEIQPRLPVEPGPPGPDGCIDTPWGDRVGYRVIFRADRKPPQRKDLAFFLEETPEAWWQRLLICNGPAELPTALNNRPDFWRIARPDLERLAGEDFQTLRRWFMGGGLPTDREIIPLHQERILVQVAEAKATQEKNTLILPGIAEEGSLLRRLCLQNSGTELVLVLVRTLARLRAIIRTWQEQGEWSTLSVLVACQEPLTTRLPDHPLLRHTDLDFPLLDKPETLRRFLGWRFHGTRVLLTTHGSLPLVREALAGLPPAELAIVEDAWNVASQPETTAWDLPATKRLFLAPLPSRHDPDRMDRDGESRRLFTLEDASRFGRLLEPLAANPPPREEGWRAIKVVLVGLADPFSPWGDLQRALAVCGVRKVLTFHDSLEDARGFARLIGGDSGWQSLYIDATMSEALQQRILTSFREAGGSTLLASHRAMIAGLGIPAADAAVFFPSVRKDAWETWSAVWGAFRTPDPGRSTPGWLLLPVVSGPSLAEGITADTMPGFWRILETIRDVDVHLRRRLRQARIQLGRTGTWDQTTLMERIGRIDPGGVPGDLTPELADILMRRLTTLWDQHYGALLGLREQHGDLTGEYRFDADLQQWIKNQRLLRKKNALSPERMQLLDGLGFIWDPERARWEQMRQRLLAYKERRGDANVPQVLAEDPELARWALEQRKNWKSQTLEPDRIASLDLLGFVWDPEAAHWAEMREHLMRFREQTGHADVPIPCPEDPALAVWVTEVRRKWRKHELTAEALADLTALGFIWDPEEVAWEGMLAHLAAWRATAGHARITDPFPADLPLGRWAEEQRRALRKGRLTDSRRQRLDKLEFVWDLEADAWETLFRTLQRSLPTEGPFPSTWPGQPELADWIARQCRMWKSGRLDPTRQARLDSLGIIWDPERREWENQFVELERFRNQFGHVHVPRESPEAPDLGPWLVEQRKKQALGRLEAERAERLTALGILWNQEEGEWEGMFATLQQFQKMRNHCVVPKDWPDNPALARWVAQQRLSNRREQLAPERIQRLDDLGFTWDSREILWEEMFALLMLYREKHNDCNVPDPWTENPDLAWWVGAQRKAYQNGNLNPKWIARLNAVGFIWDMQEALWREMYVALTTFHRRFGHCLVPRSWAENPKLASWVTAQRQAYKGNLLPQEHIALLDPLGFIWDPQQVVQEELFLALQAYKQRFGNCDVPVEWPENPQLGLWVTSQRQRRAKGDLEPERIKRLEEMGFKWE
ncbi:MAG: helicase associated domain-containing protein [Magnetococcales bacterium]|nr:helicase associated domain-containing protein [Magnetococcales bacterium]